MSTITELHQWRGVLVASGGAPRPGWKPYRYNDPAASTYRRRIAATIRAIVGPEQDAWDLPEPPATRPGSIRTGGSRSGLPYILGCGTEAAYRRHLRYGEKPCPECMDAQRKAQRARRAS